MTEDDHPLVFKRVVVAFDASPQGHALLEFAGDMAACFGSSLAGFFFEDRRMRDFAALPTAQEVSLGSAGLSGLDAKRVAAHQRAQQRLARRAVDNVARARRLSCSFFVRHGLDDLTAAMAEPEDLLMVCRGIAARPERQGRDHLHGLVRGAAGGVLALDAVRRHSRPFPVSAILGKDPGRDDAVLAIARALASHMAAPLSLLAPRTLPALEEIAARLAGPALPRSQVRLRQLRDGETLAGCVSLEVPSVVVLSGDVADDDLQALLGQGHPLLVLHQWDH